jgi:hypothetical protein
MRTSIIVLLSAGVLIAGAVVAENGGTTSPADATISDLAWLAGYWKLDRSGAVMEECWLAPAGAVMVGLHLDLHEDGNVFFEYLRIMETADGVVYYASPRGYDTTKYTLTALTDSGGVKRAVFENPEKDFPKLIRYTLDEHGLMAEAEGVEDDQNVVEVWTWQRAPFPQNPAR